MRIVVWNCQKALYRKWDILAALQPDIAIVVECAVNPALKDKWQAFPPNSYVWREGFKPYTGLAAFAFGRYTFARADIDEAGLKWFIPLRVSGPHSFHLLATWAEYEDIDKRKAKPGPMLLGIDHYRDFLTAAPLVVAGDFNNNVCFEKKGWASNHSNAVEQLSGLSLFSAYHYHHDVDQGQEPEPTMYWRNRTIDGPRFHIDYCFLPLSWQPHLTAVQVGTFHDWISHSDHVPLIVDVQPQSDIVT